MDRRSFFAACAAMCVAKHHTPKPNVHIGDYRLERPLIEESNDGGRTWKRVELTLPLHHQWGVRHA